MKKRKTFSKKVKEFVEKYGPRPLPSHQEMLDSGFEEAFRVKSTDGYSKDDIWYRRKVK